MRSITLLALACLLARPGSADEAEVPDLSNANIQIEIRATRKGTKIAGTVVTTSGTQANFTLYDPTGQAALIANFLPAVDPNHPGVIDTQFQVDAAKSAGKFDFQVQGQVRVLDGKEKVVMTTGGGNSLAMTLRVERD